MQSGSTSLVGTMQACMLAQPCPAPSRTVTSATFAAGGCAPEPGRGCRRPSALCSTWSAAHAARVSSLLPSHAVLGHAALQAEQQEQTRRTICHDVAAVV